MNKLYFYKIEVYIIYNIFILSEYKEFIHIRIFQNIHKIPLCKNNN